MKRILALISLLTLTPIAVAADALTQTVLTDYHDHLEGVVFGFHTHPELSFREERTAAIIADEFEQSVLKSPSVWVVPVSLQL